ncbi:hypothetical protein QQX98_010768, partial [Neonectria punicea]
MAFLFQPPIFLLQPRAVPLAVATPVTIVTITPVLTPPVAHSYVLTTPLLTLQSHPTAFYTLPQIRFKVIFHGTHRPGHAAGLFHACTDATYAAPPSRAVLLANLSFWATTHGLGDRVYSGQTRLHLTRDTTVVAVGTAPAVEDVVRT